VQTKNFIDYTQLYRNVYAAVKTDEMPHNLAHNVSVRIANAICDLYLYERENDLSSLPDISDLMKKFWPIKG